MTTAKHPKLTAVLRQLDPEVQPSTTRPSWTAAEKLAILQDYESYPRGAPERGALLAARASIRPISPNGGSSAIAGR
jgi:hypothetical protein